MINIIDKEHRRQGMSIEFKKVSDFSRGILFELLTDAYSFDSSFGQRCSSDWKYCDDFFFNNLQIADQCGFITTLNDEAIGFIIWDPRNIPEYVEIGHSCIVTKHKGKGYAKVQLKEAVNRIVQNDVRKIIVTTNDKLIPARRMYENVGFQMLQRRNNESITDFAGEFIDYVWLN
jgi:GNAT superfamily N-acetyltransferase